MEKISFASFWTFNIHLSKSFFSSYFFFFRTSYITAADFPHKLVFNTCSFDICMSHDFTFFQNYLLMCIKQLPWKAEKKIYVLHKFTSSILWLGRRSDCFWLGEIR